MILQGTNASSPSIGKIDFTLDIHSGSMLCNTTVINSAGNHQISGKINPFSAKDMKENKSNLLSLVEIGECSTHSDNSEFCEQAVQFLKTPSQREALINAVISM